MRECLSPQNLPDDLQHWFLMDAHLRFLSERYERGIHDLEERQEFLRVTRPPFFQLQKRQLAITEEHRLEAENLTAHKDAHRVDEAREQVEHILAVKLTTLIVTLDRECVDITDEIMADTRKFARANWLDEDQNDQAFPYILEELQKFAAPSDAPVVASVYGQDEHPKAIAQGDPWANAAD